MSEKLHRGDVEGLPKQFVSSLKVLFDILDEERSGYVRLVDIEIRWHGEGVNGLPAGVLEALRKVTPPSGLLSFERFVMGLKLAMFKSKHSNADVTSVKDSRRTPTNELTNCDFDSSDKQQQQRDQDAMFRPPHPRDLKPNRGGEGSVGVIQLHKIHAAGQINSHQANKRTYGTAITATVRPNNAINTANGNGVNPGCAGPDSDNRQHRLPHAKLNANANANIYSGHVSGSHPGVDRNERERYSSNGPPPRPLRTHVIAQSHPVNRARSPQENLPVNPAKSTQNLPVNPSKVPPQVPPRDYRKSAKSVIINELKQWQKERLRNGGNPEPPKPPRIISVSSDSRLVDKKSNPNYDIYVNIQELPPSKSDDQLDDLRPTNKVLAQRRDPRRHTVANGVDYNMVKWLKLLEEERSLLRQGLECGQRSRDWCQRRMSALQTRQRDFSHPSPSDVAVEESQLRINLLRSRVNEFLHVTKLLMEYSDKSVASQMNLAVKTVPVYDDTITINMLKEQNRMLTKEVGQKGEIITQLEREKASLIREMFEGRALAKGKSGYDDTTFL